MTADDGRECRGEPDRFSALVGRFPLTAGVVSMIALAALASGGLTGLFGLPVRRTLAAGVHRPVWTWLTSGFVCGGPGATWLVLLAAVFVLGASERRLGWCWTLVGLVIGQVLGVALGLGLIAAMPAQTVWARQLSSGMVLGPVPGMLAVLALTTGRMSALWRRRVRLVLSVSLAALVLYSGTTAHVTQLTGWLVGLTGGILLGGRRQGLAAAHPTRREGRALVALVVAVTALGPLVEIGRAHV